MVKQQFPEPTASGLIFNKDGKVFLMKSHKWKDQYVIPGGHIELGEDMETALKREIKEETNLDVTNAKLLCFHEFIFDDSCAKKKHFIFFNFCCQTDSEEVILNSEGQSYVWVLPEEALNLNIDPYTRKSIEKYLKEK